MAKMAKTSLDKFVENPFEDPIRINNRAYGAFKNRNYYLLATRTFPGGPICFFEPEYLMGHHVADGEVEGCIREFERRLFKKPYFTDFFAVKQGDVIYLNVDEDATDTLNPDGKKKYVGLSFKCICGLDPMGLEKIAKGTMVFTDYTDDEVVFIPKKLQSEARRLVLENLRYSPSLQPPDKGFSIIEKRTERSREYRDYRYVWHRSGHVLLQDKSKKKSYLLGQDEGQYFGVELPTFVKTVQDAVIALKPKEIRKCANVLRQGEWFLVPVLVKDFPNTEDCIALSSESIVLPVLTDEDNRHTVLSPDIRITKKGEIFATTPRVRHLEHTELVVSRNLIKFVRNTAVRSVSVNGVD